MHLDPPPGRPAPATSPTISNPLDPIETPLPFTLNRRRAPRIEIEDILGDQRVVGNTVFYTGEHPNHPNRIRPGLVRRSVQPVDLSTLTSIPRLNTEPVLITAEPVVAIETPLDIPQSEIEYRAAGQKSEMHGHPFFTRVRPDYTQPQAAHKARIEKPCYLDSDLLKTREDDVMHNLVLEYLSDRCFPETARILAEGLPTASTSNTSTSNPKESSLGSDGPNEELTQRKTLEVDTDVTMMSSSISDLNSIIDPSAITTSTTPGTAMPETNESTVMPSITGWSGPPSAGTITMNGNANGKTKVHQHAADVDMDTDAARLARPELQRASTSTHEIYQRKHREAWLQQIESRKEIRDSIRAGDIVRGMELLRRDFPNVLGTYGTVPASAWNKTSDDDEDKSEGSGSSVDEESNDSGESSENVDDEEREEQQEETYMVPGLDDTTTTTSVAFPGLKAGFKSVSLYLNLEIQSFIENVRQLEASSDPDMDFSSMASSMHSDLAASDGFRNGKTGVMSSGPSRDSTASPDLGSTLRNGDVLGGTGSKSSRTLTCVAQAQKLYVEATTYLDEDAAEPYVNTIESVTALLAYTDMAASPLSCWLDKKRRFTLAEMINSAILSRGNPTRHATRSRLESIARQTSAVISTCKSRGFDVSPPWKVDKEGIAMASLANMVAAKQSFDLSTFLAEQ